jgi:hypothetical protein
MENDTQQNTDRRCERSEPPQANPAQARIDVQSQRMQWNSLEVAVRALPAPELATLRPVIKRAMRQFHELRTVNDLVTEALHRMASLAEHAAEISEEETLREANRPRVPVEVRVSAISTPLVLLGVKSLRRSFAVDPPLRIQSIASLGKHPTCSPGERSNVVVAESWTRSGGLSHDKITPVTHVTSSAGRLNPTLPFQKPNRLHSRDPSSLLCLGADAPC